jgi:hypothetical protein
MKLGRALATGFAEERPEKDERPAASGTDTAARADEARDVSAATGAAPAPAREETPAVR